MAPTNLTYAVSPATYTKGSAIAPNAPALALALNAAMIYGGIAIVLGIDTLIVLGEYFNVEFTQRIGYETLPQRAPLAAAAVSRIGRVRRTTASACCAWSLRAMSL